MGSMLDKLIVLLLVGLALFVASPTSAAVATPAANRASGSATILTALIESEVRLSDEAVRENIFLLCDLASDDAVAARAGATTWADAGFVAAEARGPRVADRVGHFYSLAAYATGFRDTHVAQEYGDMIRIPH